LGILLQQIGRNTHNNLVIFITIGSLNWV
jgi:hypothetical protein